MVGGWLARPLLTSHEAGIIILSWEFFQASNLFYFLPLPFFLFLLLQHEKVAHSPVKQHKT